VFEGFTFIHGWLSAKQRLFTSPDEEQRVEKAAAELSEILDLKKLSSAFKFSVQVRSAR
jgi:hypothetical protein